MPHRAAINPPRAGEMSRADDEAAVSVAKVEAIRSGSVRSATYAFSAGRPKMGMSYRKIPGSSQAHEGAAQNSSGAGAARYHEGNMTARRLYRSERMPPRIEPAVMVNCRTVKRKPSCTGVAPRFRAWIGKRASYRRKPKKKRNMGKNRT